MKKIKLILEYYKKSMLPSFILFVVLIVTSLEILDILGDVGYQMYGYTDARKYLYNADFVATSIGGFTTERNKEIEAIRELRGVKGVLYSMKAGMALFEKEESDSNIGKYSESEYRNVSVIMYSEDYFTCYERKLDEGSEPKSTEKSEGLQCITNIEELKTGDVLYGVPIVLVGTNGYSEEKAKVKITGHFSYDEKILNMTSASTKLTLLNMFDYVTSDAVIIPLSDYAVEFFSKGYLVSDVNFYVIYEDDISNEEKEIIRKEIGKLGLYTSIDESLDVVADDLVNTIRKDSLLLLLLVFLSSISFIIVYILSTHKKMYEFSIYYIHGASRKQIFGNIFLATSAIAAIPIIISYVYIKICMHIERLQRQAGELTEILFRDSYIIIVASYLFLLILVSVLISWLMIARLSPAQAYRKMIQ